MAIINSYGIWIKGMNSFSLESEEVIFSDSNNQIFHLPLAIIDRINDVRFNGRGNVVSGWIDAKDTLPEIGEKVILEITPKKTVTPFFEIGEYLPFPATGEPYFHTSDDAWSFERFTFRWHTIPIDKDSQ